MNKTVYVIHSKKRTSNSQLHRIHKNKYFIHDKIQQMKEFSVAQRTGRELI